MYSHLERENALRSEQNGCRKGSCETKNQLLIDKTMLRGCKKRHINLAMEWVDYKKAYDMVPHSWISDWLEIFGTANNVQNFLNKKFGNLFVVYFLVDISHFVVLQYLHSLSSCSYLVLIIISYFKPKCS